MPGLVGNSAKRHCRLEQESRTPPGAESRCSSWDARDSTRDSREAASPGTCTTARTRKKTRFAGEEGRTEGARSRSERRMIPEAIPRPRASFPTSSSSGARLRTGGEPSHCDKILLPQSELRPEWQRERTRSQPRYSLHLTEARADRTRLSRLQFPRTVPAREPLLHTRNV